MVLKSSFAQQNHTNLADLCAHAASGVFVIIAAVSVAAAAVAAATEAHFQYAKMRTHIHTWAHYKWFTLYWSPSIVHSQMQKFILNTKVVCSSLFIFRIVLCAKFAIDFLFRFVCSLSLFLHLFIGFEYVVRITYSYEFIYIHNVSVFVCCFCCWFVLYVWISGLAKQWGIKKTSTKPIECDRCMWHTSKLHSSSFFNLCNSSIRKYSDNRSEKIVKTAQHALLTRICTCTWDFCYFHTTLQTPLCACVCTRLTHNKHFECSRM